MPFVHIELIKGRSDEQITNLMKDVTEAVHKNTGAPKEHIHVILRSSKIEELFPTHHVILLRILWYLPSECE